MWKRLGSLPAGAGNRRPALQQHLSPGESQPGGRDDDDDGGDYDDDQVDQQLESAQQLVAQRRSNSPQRPYPVRPKNRVRSQITKAGHFGCNKNSVGVGLSDPSISTGLCRQSFYISLYFVNKNGALHSHPVNYDKELNLRFSELQCAVCHPLPDKGDRRTEPGGGGDGSEMQDGGTRGLRRTEQIQLQVHNIVGRKYPNMLSERIR